MKNKHDKFSTIPTRKPLSLIVYGGSAFGKLLAQTILKEGAKVIIIDRYTKTVKNLLMELKKYGDVDFVDISGLEDLLKTLARIDYIYYLQNTFLLTNVELSSKDFLEQSNYINNVLIGAARSDAKFTLVTNIEIDKKRFLYGSVTEIDKPYTPEELQKYAETLTLEYVEKSKLNGRVIRLGALLGIINNVYYYPELHKLFSDAVSSAFLTVTGEGLDSYSLVHTKDALFGILKLSFDNKTKGQIISLANKNPYTVLSIAYKILELNPKASEIKFENIVASRPQRYQQYKPAKNASAFGWEPRVPFAEAIQETLRAYFKSKKIPWINTKKPSVARVSSTRAGTSSVREEVTPLGHAVNIVSKPVKKVFSLRSLFTVKNLVASLIFLIFFIPIYYFVIGPVLAISVSSVYLYNDLKTIKRDVSDIRNLDFASVDMRLDRIDKNLSVVERQTSTLKWVFNLLGKQDLYDNTQTLLFVAHSSAKGGKDLLTGSRPLIEYISNFEPAISLTSDIPTTTKEYRENLESFKQNIPIIQRGVNQISLANYGLQNLNTNVFPEKMRKYITQLQVLDNQFYPMIKNYGAISPYIPEMLGLDRRERYVILLQNQTELRSTGGWLSSYLLLGMENGQVRELRAEDIYNLEGDLKKSDLKLSPSEDIAKALGISWWGPSLSNWEPDLALLENRFEYLLQEADRTDGVDVMITVDLKTLESLLDLWGEVVPRGETSPINSMTLYQRLFDLHEEFIPGQSRKADFLTDLLYAVVKRMLTPSQANYPGVASVLTKSLTEKHIMLHCDNPQLQEYIAKSNWGNIIAQDLLTTPLIIHWNGGGNKVNKFLDTIHNLNIDIIDSKTLSYTYKLSVRNNSTSNAYPGGLFKDYLRIRLPANTSITGVSGFQNNVYRIINKGSYKQIEGWFEVPVGSTRTFDLEYTLTQKRDNDISPLQMLGNTFTGEFAIYKHPGTDNELYKIEITAPEDWFPTDVREWVIDGNSIYREFSLKSDEHLTASWSTGASQ